MKEPRTVCLKIDPALSAYLEWLDDTGREFDLHTFDLFAAGYRAAEQARDQRGTGEGGR